MKLATVAILVTALVAPALALEQKALNVNTATEEQLMTLPGMTPARAIAILNYRQANGELIQLEELTLIPQVAPIYDDIKERLTVD
jgi:competence protein ComEA